jgi:ATP-dependent DNA helicase RecG
MAQVPSLLEAPLASILGGTSAGTLRRAFGFETIGDLLRHYPRRYAHRGELTDLAGLQDGDAVTILAKIDRISSKKMKTRRGTILEVTVTDGTGELTVTWFSQQWRERELRPGRLGLFSGQVSTYGRRRQLAHPEYQLLPDGLTDDPDAAAAFANEFIAVYPATVKVTSMRIAKAVRMVLDVLGEVPDPIPADIRQTEGLIGLGQALQQIHRPTSSEQADQARARLAFEEAFVLQAVLAQRRHEASLLPARARGTRDGPLLTAFDRRLPFELTAGQQRVGAEIAHDLGGDHPMHRLVQGDVGSGKTIVALRAMLTVVDSGAQAALLAPTEVLAAQHYRSILSLLGPLAERGMLGGSEVATGVALLTGSQRTGQRRRELIEVFTGDAGIVVGTHALLQESVIFGDLGLVVVDEQHRFGVEQRSALAAKSQDGTRPHVLVMTATPIPRTVAMTVFGDLDVSTLDELPSGRSPIATHVVPVRESPAFVARAWARVREEVAAGNRAFVVCSRIGALEGDWEVGEDGESPQGAGQGEPASVAQVAARLAADELSGLSIGVMHGRLAADDKDLVMARFARSDMPDPIEVLVSTTVIEVGVDVPSATVMIVMDADRFGISQLHQLRGRVGRGAAPGLCLLFTEAPPGSPGRERLDAVASTCDGFELSRLDLMARHEGDVLGASQSGRRSSLRLIEAVRDEELIVRARSHASAIVAADPGLAGLPQLRTAVESLVRTERAEFIEKA